MREQQRWYRIGDMTLQVESDLPFSATTFSDQIELFRCESPGEDVVTIRHHYDLPDLSNWDLSREHYKNEPWAVYQTDEGWIYLGILPGGGLWKIITFAPDYSHAEIYHPDSTAFLAGKSRSLFFLPSDQIVIVWLLAYRNGFFLHSAGAIVEGQSMLFVGHSEAGKSTTTQLLIDAAARGDLDVEILCDDRNIIRQKDEGWRVYGTWSHGDIPVVSPASAPLQAICFLEKAGENSLTPLNDRQQISRRLLGHVIKSFVTAEWWNKTLDVAERLIAEGNFYVMRFDRSNLILTELEKLALKSAKAG